MFDFFKKQKQEQKERETAILNNQRMAELIPLYRKNPKVIEKSEKISKIIIKRIQFDYEKNIRTSQCSLKYSLSYPCRYLWSDINFWNGYDPISVPWDFYRENIVLPANEVEARALLYSLAANIAEIINKELNRCPVHRKYDLDVEEGVDEFNQWNGSMSIIYSAPNDNYIPPQSLNSY